MVAVTLAALPTLAVAGPRPAAAQTPTYNRDLPDSLATEATVTEAAALATAQQRVLQSEVAALEPERENGTLMCSFDFNVLGTSGIDEVNVDTKTGAVLHAEHASPAQEQREVAADAKEAKAARTEP